MIKLFSGKKTAFTLAEVLITLGVIGVVAAITIPGLMTAHKKHVTATKLERAVSVITQAIRLSENENGQMENWDKTLDNETFINTYFRPYLTIMQICSSTNPCGYSSTFKTMSGNNNAGYSNPFHADRMGLLTSDSITYFYSKVTTNVTLSNDQMIIIDINGKDKPNTFGKDVFFFIRNEDADSVIPYGGDKSYNEIKNDCSQNGSGYYCAAWIRQHGWKIPNGYPKL